MELIKVTTGLFWVEIPEKNLYLMCGCPMDSVKHLMNKKIIRSVSREGVPMETGPNAILLSDLSVQNGYFCNLAEFPILHMMYKQGMSLPGHPGNNGGKPWLIGTREQVEAQKRYIFRGNYGLAAREEFVEAGCSPEEADRLWQMKLKFNYNTILRPEDLVDTTIADDGPVELRPGVLLLRKGLNLYELSYGKEILTIDLNLEEEERYEPPYRIEPHNIRREYFSVIHVGEGNGWDNTRPCMGSIITFKGKIYLIDAGPNIEYSLNALGISVNDVEGMFHTHIHDDHFAGLTYLVMADHKVKYFATSPVMMTARKKLSALMGHDESMFDMVFDPVVLDSDAWNDLEGLEVKPVFSPHPVETSILYFRVMGEKGYKSYAHLADIVSRKVLSGFISEEPGIGISREWFDEIWYGYLQKADLKKIDVGGGFVHGEAEDFRDDPSETILLSHTDRGLTGTEMQVGSSAAFGSQEVLILSRHNFIRKQASVILKEYFPGKSEADLEVLLKNPVREYNCGETLLNEGDHSDTVFLILSGKAEYFQSGKKARYEMTCGSIIGIMNSLWGEPVDGTYKVSAYVETLAIPVSLMLNFMNENDLLGNLRETNLIIQSLRCSSLFGSRISNRNLVGLAQRAGMIHLLPGDEIPGGWPKDLYFIHKGTLDIHHKGRYLKSLSSGETWGGYPVYPIWQDLDHTALVSPDGPAELFRFSHEVLRNIPVVQWKLYQLWSCWAAIT